MALAPDRRPFWPYCVWLGKFEKLSIDLLDPHARRALSPVLFLLSYSVSLCLFFVSVFSWFPFWLFPLSTFGMKMRSIFGSYKDQIWNFTSPQCERKGCGLLKSVFFLLTFFFCCGNKLVNCRLSFSLSLKISLKVLTPFNFQQIHLRKLNLCKFYKLFN